MGGLAQQSFIDNKKSKVIKDQGWIQLRKHNIVQKKKRQSSFGQLYALRYIDWYFLKH